MNKSNIRTLAALVALLTGAANTHLHAATFSDENWSSIGKMRNEGSLPRSVGGIGAAATDGSGNLYVGGEFTIAGGVFATNMAKWNGRTWSALGSGINGSSVAALLASGNELYAGGEFTTAGGVSATNIARWDGSHWSPLGLGMNRYVSALVVSGSDLYAAGAFTNAGGSPANYIATWNGSSWSALGSGVGFVVQALAVSGGDVYAAGHFTTAGGLPANYIAKWNGASWSPLGSGMDAPVYSLAVLGSNLYAGGYFKTAGGVSATNIARWDGSNWSAVGLGIRALDGDSYYQGAVNALAVLGSDLYAAGNFALAGGEDLEWVYRIAKWNGRSWSALVSGNNDSASALALSGTDLYVGTSGDLGGYIGKARIGSIAKSIVATNSTATIQFSGVTGYEYDVQRATSLNPPVVWATVTDVPLYPAPDGSFTFTDTNAPPGTAYYRTVER